MGCHSSQVAPCHIQRQRTDVHAQLYLRQVRPKRAPPSGAGPARWRGMRTEWKPWQRQQQKHPGAAVPTLLLRAPDALVLCHTAGERDRGCGEEGEGASSTITNSFSPHPPPPTPQCVLGEQAHPSVLQLELCFVYAVVWGYGGALNAPNKRKFDTWWRKEFASVPLPASGTLWDCYLVPGEDRFSSWASLDPPFSLSQGCNDDGGGPYVRTPQSEGLGHLVNALVGRGHPVLVEGPTGSGKTSLLREALSAPAVVKGAAAESHPQLLHVYATRLSDSSSLWAQLGGGLQWHWGRRYRPRGGKRLVCFIDDLHNAQVRAAGGASLVEG